MKKRWMQLGMAAGATALILAIGSRGARAQDPAVVNSKSVHVKLENDRVRILEANLQPGEKEQMHSHPDAVVYVISGGTIRNHAPDGKTTESTLVAGDVAYRGPVTHWAENIGTTPVHLILVELKTPR